MVGAFPQIPHAPVPPEVVVAVWVCLALLMAWAAILAPKGRGKQCE